MSARVYRCVVLLFFIVWVAVAASCAGPPGQRKYRIGLGPWVGFGPLYLAQEKGFFQQQGLNADLIVLTGLAERNSALESNRIDALAAPVDSFVLAAGNGIGVKIAMSVDESNGGDGIVARSSIKSFADLRGKSVAFQRGLPSEFFLRALLKQNNMRLEDLKAVDMETAQAGAAFISNQLDAACLWEPWLSRAIKDGNGKLLASTREYPNLIVDCLAFTDATISQHPEDVQKVVDTVLQAIEYWKSHTDESNKIMAPHFQVDQATYAKTIAGLRFCDLARNREYFGSTTPGPIFQVAQRASEIWLDAKVIAKPVDANRVITAKFIQEAH
jgi:NitT/TauT family transport system substrate-binding protein